MHFLASETPSRFLCQAAKQLSSLLIRSQSFKGLKKRVKRQTWQAPWLGSSMRLAQGTSRHMPYSLHSEFDFIWLLVLKRIVR